MAAPGLRILSCKYLLMAIMSYVDYAPTIRSNYLRGFVKKYNELSLNKEEESFNMIARKIKSLN